MDKMTTTMGSNLTTVCKQGCTAVLDSTDNKIRGPSADVTSIHTALNANVTTDGHYFFNCSSVSSLPSMVFTIAGKAFPVQQSEYIKVDKDDQTLCWSRLRADDGDSWRLGAPFLKSVYTIYDQKNLQVGLATPTK